MTRPLARSTCTTTREPRKRHLLARKKADVSSDEEAVEIGGGDGDTDEDEVRRELALMIDGFGKAEKRSKEVKVAKERHKSDRVPKDEPVRLRKSSTVLKIQPTSIWHEIKLAPLDSDNSKSRNTRGDNVLAELKSRAEQLHASECDMYEQHVKSASRSDRAFFSTIVQSGTLTDKISALTLRVQESPLHNVKSLDSLIGMVRKNNRREAGLAAASLKDLMLGGALLPDSRKLRFFQDQPWTHTGVSDAHLIVWWFEDHLKRAYYELVQAMEALSLDTLEHLRVNTTGYVFELLAGRPEQEQNLLRLLVNKLGDAERKVASRANYLLLRLLQQHPAMKLVVVAAIEEFALRSGTQLRAQYYAMITLNQIVLTAKEHAVANRLIDLYFAFFKKLLLADNGATQGGGNGPARSKALPKKGMSKAERERKLVRARELEAEVNEQLRGRTVAAVLTGVNRAFPFANVADTVYEQYADTLFRVAHTGSFNVVMQALKLTFQICSAKASVSDRFHRVLYAALADPRLVTTSKQAMFLNLFYQAIKTDTESARQQAFMKRAVQVAAQHQPPFVCGLLFALSELVYHKPGLKRFILQAATKEDGAEEHAADVPDSDTSSSAPVLVSADAHPSAATAAADGYDGRKRDPKYANAERTCLWELVLLTQHYHPAVALHAQCLIECKRVPYAPQLEKHTLAHFLDRFVYRNPKNADGTASAASRGGSVMQPTGVSAVNVAGSAHVVSWQRGGGIHGAEEMPLHSNAFATLVETKVAPEEVFFHRFFVAKKERDDFIAERRDKKRRKKHGSDEDGDVHEGEHDRDDDDDEEEEEGEKDELDEDEVWEAMQQSMSGFTDMQMDSDASNDGDDDDDDDDDEDGDEHDAFVKAMMTDEDEYEVSNDEEDDTREEEEEEEDEPRRKRRSKRRDLPVFASFDDYADMLDNDGPEDEE